MKVLYVDHYLPGSVYTLELAKEIKHEAHTSIFCKETTVTEEEGIHWLPYLFRGESGKVKGLFKYIGNLRDLALIINKGHYDVVHVQSCKKMAAELQIYRLCRKKIGKLVHTVHNVLPHEASASDKRLFGAFYELCDELIVHNEVSKKILMETFPIPEEKITVIPHGSYQTYPVEPVYGRKNNKRMHFLMFGFVRKYKGIDLLLEAVAKLDDTTRRKCFFTIIGHQYKNFDSTDYQAMIDELHIGDCVEFIPERVEDDDIPALFGRVDVGIFPYRSIFGSGSLLMSYTYRLPVVVSDLPALIEEIENDRTGISFVTEDTDDLARAITKAANWTDEEYRGYQSEIERLLKDKYSWKSSAKKTLEVYRR